jgi:peptidoglycan/LPS O-acetylase OafA/YrhL
MARRPIETGALTRRPGRAVGTPTVQHPSLGRVHLRARVPPDIARRRAVRHQLHGVADTEFRPDVEGLRALAVVVVVLFHLRLGAFQGGFVGVDVFFVLSGFLITRLLVNELASTGTLHLPSFWGRRARRLLPASVLVIVVTVLAATFCLSPLAQRTLGTDAMAAGVFVINFVFAGRFGDYFAAQLAEAQPSPLLHYWSLAVEEQFYLLWPLLLVVLARRPRQYRRLLLAAILAIAAASLVTSIWMTEARPTWAFYLLPARMVELLAGAALAVAGPAFRTVSPTLRAALGWFGLVGIAVAVLTFDLGTVFPGYMSMLPVLATVLVIVAGGAGGSPMGPVVALRHPVALWIGRHSYAIYLWHWPVLVLAEARYGPLPLPTRALLVGVAVALSAASLRLVENPVRHSPWLAKRAARGLALGAALCATAVMTGAWLRATDAPLDSGEIAAAPTLPAPTVPAQAATTLAAQPATEEATAAPAALTELPAGDIASLIAANRAVLEQGLAQTDVPSNLRPSLRDVGGDRAAVYRDDCVAVGRTSQLNACRYGVDGAAFTIILYGDSHAAQWFPAVEQIAEDHGAELIVMIKGGCPTAAVSIPTATLARTCPIWRDQAVATIAAEQPDLLLVSASAGYPNDDEEWAAGFDATMRRIVPNAGHVVVIGDTPESSHEPTDCLSRNVRSADRCASDRSEVVAASRLRVEQEVTAALGADYVDTTDWLCAEVRCPMMIGDILLYRDSTHITTVASRWFGPLLEASLDGDLPTRQGGG